MGTVLNSDAENAPGDIDPSDASTVEEIARCLMQLYIRADMPSLRKLERETMTTMGRPLADSELRSVRLNRASLNSMLGGRKLPGKAFYLTFVQACGIDLQADRRWMETWDRLVPSHPAQALGWESELREQVAAMEARAQQAETDNEQLRERVAELRARAEQAEAYNQQLRMAIVVRVRPEQANPAEGPPEPAPLRRWDPRQIGPFVLTGRLGSGAMGHVYLGRSLAGRQVAVKTIRSELAEESGFRERFAQEIAAARQVSGMFTASVVAADPEADMPWLATAYVPAPTLSWLVRARGPLPTSLVWWLAAGCAEALESIHGTGLIHGDLKPSNVLVAPSGPLVIDFGIARDTERVEFTVPPGAAGTPAYMSPEQVRDGLQASTASDVFALGATLLFAATGHAPHQGKTVVDVLFRLANEPADLSGLPAELTELITCCLASDPANRPTSEELLAQLEPRLNDLTLSPTTNSRPTESLMTIVSEFQRAPWSGEDNETAGQ